MKDKILKLRREGKKYAEIQKILGVASSTVSYHCKKDGLGRKEIKKPNIDKLNKYYKTHTLKETASFFKLKTTYIKGYLEKKRGKKLSKYELLKRDVLRTKNRRNQYKLLAVNYLGGKCNKCGYNKYIGALEFHHINPKEKSFTVGSKIASKSWVNLKRELDKCELLCSNCHKELHADIYKIK